KDPRPIETWNPASPEPPPEVSAIHRLKRQLHLQKSPPKTFFVSSQVKYVAAINSQLKLTRCPHSLAATLTALPSMSLIPFAPFSPVRQGTNPPWWVASAGI